MSVEDPGIWKQAANWLWGLLLPLIGLAWHGANKRLDEVKLIADEALPRSDFDAHLERSLEDRRTLREDVRELFARDDRMRDIVNKKFDDLRKDMHEGFERVSREIRTREGRT